ncbi:MAG: FtsX-like permease family protein [Bacillota bacterium]
MKNAYLKDCFRQALATKNRFLAILVISALGVAFFSGLRATGPDMRSTAAEYFDRSNFMDIRLVSTVGFDDGDVAAVRAVQGVQDVMPAYSYDALAELPERNLTIQIQSINRDEPGLPGVNLSELTAGQMPQKSGECLADPRFIETTGYGIGDTVHLISGTSTPVGDDLKTDAFRIVGIADNPLYISYERGSSSVGSGKSEGYLLILPEDFDLPAYTDIYLTVENGAGISRFEGAYGDLLEGAKDALEQTGEVRAKLRYDDIVGEAQEKLDDAKEEVADARKKIDDAQKELDDAAAELEDGRLEYEKNKRKFEKRIADAQKALDDGYKQYEQGLADYEAGLAEYETSKRDALAQLDAGQAQLDAAREQYYAGKNAYDQAKSLYDGLSGALAAGNTPEALGAIQMLAAALPDSAAGLKSALLDYANNPADPMKLAIAQGALGAFGAELEQSRLQLEAGKAELDAQTAAFGQARSEALNELAKGQSELDDAEKKLDESKATLDEKSAELDKGRREGRSKLAEAAKDIEEAEKKLSDAEQEFAQEKAKAEKELSDAEAKIDDGEKELSELKDPQWYVLDHDMNAGFNGYKQDTSRLEAISLVMPVLFFLVAVLVTMTAMTRLVDSDRLSIGTLKALGYSDRAIVLRYLVYATAASLVGSVIGVMVGFNVLPRVIFNAYSMLYTLPPLHVEFNVPYALVSIGAAVVCAAVPAALVCMRSAREAPAQLMRPVAPRMGRRTPLEYIPFLWKRLHFSQKVAIRNLFRYRKRLIMTLVGVAGCTALMFTGFGLRDAISTIIGKQFGKIQTYDLRIDFQQDASEEDRKSLEDTVKGSGDILSSTVLMHESVDASHGDREKSVFLVVPEDAAEFSEYIRLAERRTENTLSLSEDSVIITEKLAVLLNVKVGDTVELVDGDAKRAEVRVGGITENYLYHYVYMAPKHFLDSFGEAPRGNQILCKLASAAAAGDEALSKSLLDEPAVSAVTFSGDTMGRAEDMTEALRYVVLVLIVSAGALVFVVLFSLNSINLEERERELATIKLLGFYDRELAAYLYRENIALTVLGIAAGLLLGIALQRYVVVTMEIDMLMFSRDLLWTSYVYSAGLTGVFAVFVNLIMLRHIKRIDMVSSLKSIE